MTGAAARVVGVDAARGLALIGMAAAHVHATTTPDGGATLVGQLVAGRASALFAVLAGVGIALSTRRVREPAGPHHATTRLAPPNSATRGMGLGLVVRAVIVGLLGLTLETVLDTPPAVILAQYGLLFLVAVPLLRVRRPAVLFGAAAVWCVVSPVLSHLLRAGTGGSGPQPSFTMPPGELLTTLALTGYYPVLTWTTYLLVGLGVGRLDLRAPRTAWWLVGVGAALASIALGFSTALRAAGVGPVGVDPVQLTTQRAGVTPPGEWGWLVTDGRHTGTAFDLAHTTGVALLVLGVCLLLPRAVAALPAGPGAIPLTLYTAHVVVGGLWGPFGTAAWVVQVVVALVVGGVLRAAGRRGPLEPGVAAASRAAVGLRRRRTASPAPPGAGRSAGPGAG